MTANEKNSPNAGHRQRLREEVRRNPRDVAEYKLLEMLLTYVQPRKDTRQLAKRLLETFGNIRGVLDAGRDDLLRVQDMGPMAADLWGLLRELWARREETEPFQKEKLCDNFTVARLARARLRGLKEEEIWAALVDHQLYLIDWIQIAQGICNSTHFYPHKVVRECLLRRAWGFVLVHNHPGGTAKPSKADIEITTRMIHAAAAVNLHMVEHIIVTDTDYCGLRERGDVLPPQVATDLPPF